MHRCSKEDLFEELLDCINIMNAETFKKDYVCSYVVPVKIKLVGKFAAYKILKQYNKTTLYELTTQQLEESISFMHMSVIKRFGGAH